MARGAVIGKDGKPDMIAVKGPEAGTDRQHENGSDVLVDQDRVALRIDQHEAGRPGSVLVSLAEQLQALLLQTALQLAHVGKAG